MTYTTPGDAATSADGESEEVSGEFKWPDMARLLDGVTMCRSVSLYALRGWFDAEVDLKVARAERHRWDHDQAVNLAIERLRETLHTAVDTIADLKLSVGAEGRIQ